ncbi:copper chaperone-like protein [Chaetoceros tenuissimus]|jgi:copper chaperone|uniref:Copper chaperone-like protein n=1 Tax=Chaetoceros tenuissimus TaxID=426638 RepID=A0AAD3DDB6_9STRA|nr:copper chaperone-like protein [Chaetoceros tenuissimus]
MPELALEVGMTCEGCAGAIKRILGKMDGVTNVETNVEEKSVKVTADEGVTAEQCAEKLAKWSAASGKYVKVP